MKTLWLVTFVTHNSRVSNRMIQLDVRKGSPIRFAPAQIKLVAEALIAAWTRHKISICACNVLPDHVHLILAAESEEELNESVRKLKGFSSYKLGKAIPEKTGALWQQKFNRKVIPDKDALSRAFEYVWNNHYKHLPHDDEPGNGLQPIGLRSDKGLKPPCLASESGNGLQPIETNSIYTVEKHEAIVTRLREACITIDAIYR